jgi:hypothetical protein
VYVVQFTLIDWVAEGVGYYALFNCGGSVCKVIWVDASDMSKLETVVVEGSGLGMVVWLVMSVRYSWGTMMRSVLAHVVRMLAWLVV